MREVFVISDLHLGGRYPQSAGQNERRHGEGDGPTRSDQEGAEEVVVSRETEDRGFRLLTQKEMLSAFLEEIGRKEQPVELVINGDFVDFLAEAHDDEPTWRPFIADEREAVEIFRRIVNRDPEIFGALKEFLAAGHMLTLLMGNHDLELCLPAVRRELERTLGIGPHDYLFLHDGEAYAVGDVLIEHGNRYDSVNSVDEEALLYLRRRYSRRDSAPAEAFLPPLGSRLVSKVFNPIKKTWPFIDLLKPESEALVAVLLALDPDLRGQLRPLIGAWAQGPLQQVQDSLLGPATDISSSRRVDERSPGQRGGSGPGGERSAPVSSASAEDPLASLLHTGLGNETADFLAALDRVHGAEIGEAPEAGEGVRGARAERGDERSEERFLGQDISAKSAWAKFSVLRQILNGRMASWEDRVYLVRQALKALHGDESFRRDVEANSDYLDAAESLTRGRWPKRPRYKTVIFGHTHLPKDLDLESGARYLNTGSWADQMRFPPALTDPSNEKVREGLLELLEDLKQGRLGEYIHFEPLYVKIEVDEFGETRTSLEDYSPGSIVPARGAAANPASPPERSAPEC